MKFRSAVLIALESWFIPDHDSLVKWSTCDDDPNAPVLHSILQREGLVLEGKGPRQTGIARADAKLLLYAPNDFVAGTRVLYRNRRAPPEPWGGGILRSVLRGHLIGPYLTWVGMVEFDCAHMDEHMNGVRAGGLSAFDPLLETILPNCIGQHVVLPYRAKRRAVCCLYLEPETHLPFNLKYGRALEVGPSFEPLSALLGLTEIAAIAHPQADLLLLRGQGWNPPEIELAAIRLRPLPDASGEDIIQLPETAMDLAYALSYFPIYRSVAERLRAHPFLAVRPEEYTRKISQQRHIYDAYERTFVRDRASATLLGLESDGCTEILEQRIAANRYLAPAEAGPTKGIEFDAAGQMFVKSHNNINETLRRELATVRSAVAQRVRLLKNREQAYSEFLRDMAIAQSTRENIKLQSMIRLLTIAAIAVALLALGIGLLTDKMKAAAIHWLSSPF